MLFAKNIEIGLSLLKLFKIKLVTFSETRCIIRYVQRYDWKMLDKIEKVRHETIERRRQLDTGTD